MKIAMFIILYLAIAQISIAQKSNIGYVYPCGAERGSTTEIILGGQGLEKVTGVVISGDGIKAELIIAKNAKRHKKPKKASKKNIGEEDNLQLAQTLKVRLTISSNAKLGMRDLRVVSPTGLSNRLLFEIGQLNNFYEKEPNSSKQESNYIEKLPCTVNGQILRSDVDRFTFTAKKDEDIVITVKARSFMPFIADAVPGWFQPTLTLFDSEGREIAYNDDYKNSPDPTIITKIPQDGDYTFEIKDALYRGREDFMYRIDVGTIPFITSIYPLGGKENSKVDIVGVNLSSSSIKVKSSDIEEGNILINAKGEKQLISNLVSFQLSKSNESHYEKSGKPMLITIGDIVNAKITNPLEKHIYAIDIKKNERISFDVMARRLGSPIDAKLILVDVQGAVIAENDDKEDEGDGLTTHHADPQIIHHFKKTGRYYIQVLETQDKSGEEYSYRLKVDKSKPDYELRIAPSTIVIPQGGTTVFNIFVIRKGGFNGTIDLKIDDLPDGFEVKGTKIAQGMKKATLTITAPQDIKQGTLNFNLHGIVKAADGTIIKRDALPVESMMQAFYYTHLIPTEEFRADITPALPFRIAVESGNAPIKLEINKPQKIKVIVNRNDGYSEPITIMVRGNKLPGIAVDAVTIEKDQTETYLEFTLEKARNSKRIPVIITGVVKGSSKRVAGKAKNAFAASVTANAPIFEFELTVISKKEKAQKWKKHKRTLE